MLTEHFDRAQCQACHYFLKYNIVALKFESNFYQIINSFSPEGFKT
jgi:hypothetical protein